jgi:hypothetical protein
MHCVIPDCDFACMRRCQTGQKTAQSQDVFHTAPIAIRSVWVSSYLVQPKRAYTDVSAKRRI